MRPSQAMGSHDANERHRGENQEQPLRRRQLAHDGNARRRIGVGRGVAPRAQVFTDSLRLAADTAGVHAGGKPAMIIRARANSHARHIA
jgi:hypothetical protein